MVSIPEKCIECPKIARLLGQEAAQQQLLDKYGDASDAPTDIGRINGDMKQLMDGCQHGTEERGFFRKRICGSLAVEEFFKG